MYLKCPPVLCSPHQGRPGSFGAQHALPLGPGTEERGARSGVQARVCHDRKREEGPGRRDWGHCEHREEKVLRVSEESGSGRTEPLPSWERSGGLTHAGCRWLTYIWKTCLRAAFSSPLSGCLKKKKRVKVQNNIFFCLFVLHHDIPPAGKTLHKSHKGEAAAWSGQGWWSVPFCGCFLKTNPWKRHFYQEGIFNLANFARR